jgi:hypothetical protein
VKEKRTFRVFDEYTHFVCTEPLARVTLYADETNTAGGWLIMFADQEVDSGKVTSEFVPVQQLARNYAEWRLAEAENELMAPKKGTNND